MNHKGTRIAIVGPESTGKTILAQKLAEYYKGKWIPEYARDYIEKLERPYKFSDVEHIARWLIDAYDNCQDAAYPVFFDTEMIITKVWFDVAFGKLPDQMEKWLKHMDFDAFLLCYPDLPWKPDPVRENGGKMREILYHRYRTEIEKLQKPYQIIKGHGAERMANASKALNKLTGLPDLTKTIKADHSLKALF